MKYETTLIAGCVFGLLAVGIGAFGAHALKELLTENQRTETFELAVRYQFYHAFALVAAGVLQRLELAGRWAPIFFTIGIIIFSGSLFMLSLSGVTLWGAVTPIGGVSFILGWGSLILGLSNRK